MNPIKKQRRILYLIAIDKSIVSEEAGHESDRSLTSNLPERSTFTVNAPPHFDEWIMSQYFINFAIELLCEPITSTK